MRNKARAAMGVPAVSALQPAGPAQDPRLNPLGDKRNPNATPGSPFRTMPMGGVPPIPQLPYTGGRTTGGRGGVHRPAEFTGKGLTPGSTSVKLRKPGGKNETFVPYYLFDVPGVDVRTYPLPQGPQR